MPLHNHNLSFLLDQRSLHFESRSIQKHIHSHASLIKSLGLETRLQGHRGCVNRLAWSRDGRYLVSGSDDRKAIVWDYATRHPVASIATRHEGNIFGVGFLPFSNDALVATCAADCEVQLHAVRPLSSTSDTFLRNWGCHTRRVKSLAVDPSSPFVLWTGSEDCTVRQFDTREEHTCRATPGENGSLESTCSSILVDLRSETPLAEVKSVAVNAAFSHYLALGCGDGTVRLYDRRMCSSSPSLASLASGSAPGAVSLFGSEKSIRSNSVTHVAFSKSGFELLANVSCNNIYLYDIFDTARRRAFSSLSLPQVEPPFKETEQPASSEAESLKSRGNSAFMAGRFTDAIRLYSDAIVLSPHSSVIYANRSTAYLKRKWIGDADAALRDANMALCLNRETTKAWIRKVDALRALDKPRAARAVSQMVSSAFPDIADRVKVKSPAAAGSGEDARASSQSREGQPLGDDLYDDAPGAASGSGHSSPVIQSKPEAGDTSAAADDDEGDDSAVRTRSLRLPAIAHTFRYVGHTNCQTDIKEAVFIGDNDQFIGAGSDDGRLFIWDRDTGNVVLILKGDRSIVNCVQPHPVDCTVATSGIDHTVSLWAPRAGNGESTVATCDDIEAIADICAENQRTTAACVADPFASMHVVSLVSILRAMRRAGVPLRRPASGNAAAAAAQGAPGANPESDRASSDDRGGDDDGDDDDDDDDDEGDDDDGEEAGEAQDPQECRLS